MQKSRALLQAVPTMDIEHINQIGNLIADLSAYRRANGGIFDFDRKALRLNEVNTALENPWVWTNPSAPRSWARKSVIEGWWTRSGI